MHRLNICSEKCFLTHLLDKCLDYAVVRKADSPPFVPEHLHEREEFGFSNVNSWIASEALWDSILRLAEVSELLQSHAQ